MRKHLAAVTAVLGITGAALSTPIASAAPVAIQIDNAQYQQTKTLVDPYDYYWGESPSFVAWYLNQSGIDFSNNYEGVHWGNVDNWHIAALESPGVTISNVPTLGSVAITDAHMGHAAIVTAINGDGTIDVAEYNHVAHHVFDTRVDVPATAFNHYLTFTQTIQVEKLVRTHSNVTQHVNADVE